LPGSAPGKPDREGFRQHTGDGLAQKDWRVKVESDGKTTRLTDNAWAVQATRAAAALWGVLSGPVGVYLALTSGWELSDNLLIGLLFAAQAPVAIGAALWLPLTSAVLDPRKREIRLTRKSLLSERSERIAFADIVDVVQSAPDEGRCFVSLKLRSGASVLLTRVSVPADDADAVAAAIRSALAEAR
jgi:hypothetical protein